MSDHADAQHARLSPSSAHRWATCPGSVLLVESMNLPEDPGSFYSREGTACHALAEVEARHALTPQPGTPGEQVLAYQADLEAWRTDNAEYDEDEMRPHVRAYVDLLRSLLAAYPNSLLFLEQRMPTGVESCWGTSDAVIVSPDVVHVVDLKYGRGVTVDAADNEQLRLYGVGALETYGDLLGEVKEVTVTVFQPRIDHVDSETLTAADLRAWRDDLIPVAAQALEPGAPFNPSTSACKWCPASGNCAAQSAFFAAQDFGVQPGGLSVEDLADLLPQLDGIEQWCAAVRTSALTRAYGGEALPGYKVVRSSGKRYVSDEAGVMSTLDLLGFDREAYCDTKVKGIGQLEKLGVMQAITPYVSKTEGKPALAQADDKRPAIDSMSEAVSDFAQPDTTEE